MPETIITLGELKAQHVDWMREFATDWAKNHMEPAGIQAQQTAEIPLATVPATIDGKPVAADLVRTDQADMKALGIPGLIESGDNIKILNFELGPVTSAAVGLFTGFVANGIISAKFPAWLEAGKPTNTKSPTTTINWINPAIKVVTSAAVATYGPKYVGRMAAYFFAGSVLLSLAITYTPFADWVTKLVKKIVPTATPPVVSAGQDNHQVQTRQLYPGQTAHESNHHQSLDTGPYRNILSTL